MTKRTMLVTIMAAAAMAVLWNPAAPAQENAAAAAPAAQDSLRVWRSLFSFSGSGIKYSYGSERGDVGLTGGAVKRVLRDDPPALREAQSFGRFKTWSLVASGCCGACLGLGLSVQMNEKGRAPQTYYLAGAGFLVAEVVLSEMGYGHLKKAVGLFNGHKFANDR